MSRRDKLTRQLGDPRRRKRRNIEPITIPSPGGTGAATGGDPPTGGGTADGCPNIGPPESGAVWKTTQGTGSQQGHVYTDVPLTLLGLEDCTKTISYCFCARVGPSDSPSTVSCTSTFGKTHSGLIGRPLKMLSLRDWTGNVDDAKIVRKDGLYAIEMQAGAQIIYAPIDWPATADLYVQLKYQYEGTAALTDTNVPLEGSSSIYTGRLHSGYPPEQQYQMNFPEIQITNESGAVYASYWVGKSGGLFSNVHRNDLKIAGSSAANAQWRQVHTTKFWHDGSNIDDVWVSVIENQPTVGGADPLRSATGADATADKHFGLYVDSGDCDACGFSLEPVNGVGRVWFWEILLMEHHKVFFEGIPEGYHIVLDDGNGSARWTSRSRNGASAAGDLEVWPVWRGEFGDAFETYYLGGSPDDTDCGGTWGSFPATRLRMYDDDPCNGGSVVVDCVVDGGIYGGDVWVYDSGGLTDTGTVANVYSTIMLSFLGDSDAVLSYQEPTGANTVAWTRTGSNDLTIPTGTKKLRFTQWKRGAPDGYGEVDDLQVNVGSTCCPYSPPQWQFYIPDSAGSETEPGITEGVGISPNDVVYNPATGDSYAHIWRIWSDDYEAFITATDVYDSIEEHRQGASNILQLGLAERETAGATGSESGTAYPDIVLADYGIEPGQIISVRFQAKREA